MALLKIVHYPASVLLKVGKPVETFDYKLERLVSDMFETMYAAGGVGLAAPQVGISNRFFVMDCSSGQDPSRRFVIINPEIVTTEGEQIGNEGCLSFPGIYTQIKREMRVIVRFQNLKGELQELDFTGLEARCVLHETDHCDGIVFLNRMTPLKRAMAKRKIKEFQKTGKWETLVS
ncbi:MAG: peptide deformylase [Pyrinomonadaceae bacterium]|nr:peptide deformylase [Pyrinomonadaceae bacterium]MCX7639796.1 peptide deformylase [Pyrinomonadaceae bacterium]MDW8304379.1 peptide deformylase [Acidobacteriota bacterium]